MNKSLKYLAVAVALVAVVAVAMHFSKSGESSPTPTVSGSPHACTMEAKLCPDGSAVGRSGPNCEFAPCPSPKATIPTPVKY